MKAQHWLVAAVVGICGIALCGAYAAGRASATQDKAPMRLTRIYASADGQSHAEDVDVKFGVADALGLMQSEALSSGSVNFVRFPPNFLETWHHAHARRFVITLSGKGEIELSDGHKVALEAGHVLLTEDLTGKGHIARALTADWTALFVQLADAEKGQ